MTTQRNHERAPDKAHVSVSMDKEMVRKLDEIAAKEDRPRSYMIRRMLLKEIEIYLKTKLQ
jgi:predicted transcriptional regulator